MLILMVRFSIVYVDRDGLHRFVKAILVMIFLNIDFLVFSKRNTNILTYFTIAERRNFKKSYINLKINIFL